MIPGFHKKRGLGFDKIVADKIPHKIGFVGRNIAEVSFHKILHLKNFQSKIALGVRNTVGIVAPHKSLHLSFHRHLIALASLHLSYFRHKIALEVRNIVGMSFHKSLHLSYLRRKIGLVGQNIAGIVPHKSLRNFHRR